MTPDTHSGPFANPFQFGAANDLTPDELLDYYIEDFNYSRFIRSKRNVFVLGERGSGKTMTLLYNGLTAQRRKSELADISTDLDWIGVYVPCNTPLIHRTEHELLKRFKAAVLSEHFLVLALVHHVALTLDQNADLVGAEGTAELATELGDALGRDLPKGKTLFQRLLTFTALETNQTQQRLNRADSDSFYAQALSFPSLVVPLLQTLRRIPALANSHYLLMIDDAHDLNVHQLRCLNSWIAYRDHSLFSFKVATAKWSPLSRVTASGGSILEGHDYTVVDMEKPLQHDKSDFARLATRIVSRRLSRIGIDATPQEFFPPHPSVEKELAKARAVARRHARKKYPDGDRKKISDYVYKYHRSIYFRDRSPKANLPVYAGFGMITYLSSGVIRNLLEPCFWMYDKAVSLERESECVNENLSNIKPTIQNEIIIEQSDKMWARLDEGLDKIVAGCNREEALQLRRLFEGLAELFRHRLLRHRSEPRAISFSVSGSRDGPDFIALERLLVVARKATFLYSRPGVAKESGAREPYHVPNRMLWPTRGLDPQGQHARVSLRATTLMALARGELSSLVQETNEVRDQRELF